MRWSQARKRKLVDRSAAGTIGKVTGIIVDPGSSSVAALIVDGTDAGTVISWDDAGGFGPDAVTVPSTDAIRLPRDDREQLAADGTLDPIGKPVFDESGDHLGKLRDLTFDAETGVLEVLLLGKDADPIVADRLMGIGSHSVVVRATSR
jgi:sporulation protein YlmC with PRC-barrel domain